LTAVSDIIPFGQTLSYTPLNLPVKGWAGKPEPGAELKRLGIRRKRFL